MLTCAMYGIADFSGKVQQLTRKHKPQRHHMLIS